VKENVSRLLGVGHLRDPGRSAINLNPYPRLPAKSEGMFSRLIAYLLEGSFPSFDGKPLALGK
jgi:hypothetical protein